MVKRFALYSGLAVAAIALSITVYGLTGRDGTQTAAAGCSASTETVEAISPHLQGEVAAVVPAETPGYLPELTFKNAAGEELSLADWQGRLVLLNLWATWCAPCRHEMPALDKLQGEFGGEEFEVVAVALDRAEPEKPAAFLEEIGNQNLALYTDNTFEVFQSLRRDGHAFGLPTTILIDTNGCTLGVLSGPAEWFSEDARNLIRAALGSAQTS